MMCFVMQLHFQAQKDMFLFLIDFSLSTNQLPNYPCSIHLYGQTGLQQLINRSVQMLRWTRVAVLLQPTFHSSSLLLIDACQTYAPYSYQERSPFPTHHVLVLSSLVWADATERKAYNTAFIWTMYYNSTFYILILHWRRSTIQKHLCLWLHLVFDYKFIGDKQSVL